MVLADLVERLQDESIETPGAGAASDAGLRPWHADGALPRVTGDDPCTTRYANGAPARTGAARAPGHSHVRADPFAR
jgi:hypothetical protein